MPDIPVTKSLFSSSDSDDSSQSDSSDTEFSKSLVAVSSLLFPKDRKKYKKAQTPVSILKPSRTYEMKHALKLWAGDCSLDQTPILVPLVVCK